MKEGNVIRFMKDNDIIYSQDFSLTKGMPPGIDFTFIEVVGDWLRFEAQGFGQRGAYGNGHIYIGKTHFDFSMAEKKVVIYVSIGDEDE